MRLHHYSIHTERTYTDWIKRYVHFHGMRSREDLAGGERKIESCLSNLAMKGKVASSMIYTHVLQQGGQGVPSPLDDLGM